MLDECDFLSPGSSNKFLTMEALMMEGIAMKVMTKAVMQVNVIVNMNSFNSPKLGLMIHVMLSFFAKTLHSLVNRKKSNAVIAFS